MIRDNPDGTRTPLTMPNHALIKCSTVAIRQVMHELPHLTSEDLDELERAEEGGVWIEP